MNITMLSAMMTNSVARRCSEHFVCVKHGLGDAAVSVYSESSRSRLCFLPSPEGRERHVRCWFADAGATGPGVRLWGSSRCVVVFSTTRETRWNPRCMVADTYHWVSRLVIGSGFSSEAMILGYARKRCRLSWYFVFDWKTATGPWQSLHSQSWCSCSYHSSVADLRHVWLLEDTDSHRTCTTARRHVAWRDMGGRGNLQNTRWEKRPHPRQRSQWKP